MLVPAGCLRLRVLLRVGCSTGKDREFRVFRFRGRGSVGLLRLWGCHCFFVLELILVRSSRGIGLLDGGPCARAPLFARKSACSFPGTSTWPGTQWSVATVLLFRALRSFRISWTSVTCCFGLQVPTLTLMAAWLSTKMCTQFGSFFFFFLLKQFLILNT